MKFKKFFTAFALSSLVVAGALFASQSAGGKADLAKAETDVGTVTFDTVISGDATYFYAHSTTTNDIPSDWAQLKPASNEDGVFVDGLRLGISRVQKADIQSYYVPLEGVAVDSVVTVKGYFADENFGLTVAEFTRQWDGSNWVDPATPVVDLGTFTFDGVNGDSSITGMFGINWTINDAPAGWDSVAFTPSDENSGSFIGETRVGAEIKKVGPYTYYIGLSNVQLWSVVTVKGDWSNGSYKFSVNPMSLQWNGSKWINPLTDLGEFTFDGANGDSTINNMYGINWTANEAPAGWETEAFRPYDASSGAFIGETRVGTEIKKLGPNTYYIAVTGAETLSVVTVKGLWVNSTYKFSVKEISLQWNGSKWINPLTDLGEFNFDGANGDSAVTYIYGINWTINDAPAGWDSEAFAPLNNESGTFIGETRVGAEIKKIGPNTYYVAVTGADVGSIATIKGVWINSTYKFSVKEISLQWDGAKWNQINPNYEAGDFAKELLLMTMGICTGGNENNHDALVAVWATLAGNDHYGMLVMDEKDVLKAAEADKDIVVPSTSEGIEGMIPEDAIGAAMYRYDYCTAKYSLNSFIEGRPEVPNQSSYYNTISANENSNTIIIVVVALSALAFSLLTVLVIKKRKQR